MFFELCLWIGKAFIQPSENFSPVESLEIKEPTLLYMLLTNFAVIDFCQTVVSDMKLNLGLCYILCLLKH